MTEKEIGLSIFKNVRKASFHYLEHTDPEIPKTVPMRGIKSKVLIILEAGGKMENKIPRTKASTRKVLICVLLTTFLFSAAAFSLVDARTKDATIVPPDQIAIGDVPIAIDDGPVLFRAQDNNTGVADDNSTLTVRPEDNVTVPGEDSTLVTALDEAVNDSPDLVAAQEQVKPDYTAMIIVIVAVVATVVTLTVLTITRLRKKSMQ